MKQSFSDRRMKRSGLKIGILLVVLLTSPFAASARFKFYPNAYKNEYRKQILLASGFIRENPDKTITNLKPVDVINKPLICRLVLDSKGNIEALGVIKSSGDVGLNEKAQQIIRRAAPFKLDPASSNTLFVRFLIKDILVTEDMDER